jgi:hypothetical protein
MGFSLVHRRSYDSRRDGVNAFAKKRFTRPAPMPCEAPVTIAVFVVNI